MSNALYSLQSVRYFNEPFAIDTHIHMHTHAHAHTHTHTYSYRKPAVEEELCQLVQKQPHELAEFFWRHLERDLELLGKTINKNAEECALVLHLVLKNIVICDKVPPG